MKKLHRIILAAPLAMLLAACNPGTTISGENGTVSAKGDRITLRADGHPNAHIDEAGNLLVDGKKVEVSPGQRALLQDYQREFNAMTAEGIAIGKQGAAMAGKAVSAAIKGAMSGDGESIEKTMEGEARLLEQEALKLCERLLVIRGVQDQLAADLPAFRPYATIDAADVRDCGGSDRTPAEEPALQASSPDPAAN